MAYYEVAYVKGGTCPKRAHLPSMMAPVVDRGGGGGGVRSEKFSRVSFFQSVLHYYDIVLAIKQGDARSGMFIDLTPSICNF